MFYYCVLNKNSSSCFNWYWYWRRWKRLTSFWERQTGAASVTLIVHLHLNKRTRAACLEFWKVFATTSNSLTPWPLNGLTLRDQNSCRWTSDQLAEKWPFLTLPGLIFVIGNVPIAWVVSRSWCLAITLGTTFWMWCDLWRFHSLDTASNFCSLLEVMFALINKLVHSQLNAVPICCSPGYDFKYRC